MSTIQRTPRVKKKNQKKMEKAIRQVVFPPNDDELARAVALLSASKRRSHS